MFTQIFTLIKHVRVSSHNLAVESKYNFQFTGVPVEFMFIALCLKPLSIPIPSLHHRDFNVRGQFVKQARRALLTVIIKSVRSCLQPAKPASQNSE